jgi:hypothetical protein
MANLAQLEIRNSHTQVCSHLCKGMLRANITSARYFIYSVLIRTHVWLNHSVVFGVGRLSIGK